MSLSNFGQAVADKVRDLACQALNNPLIDGRQWGSDPPFRGGGVADNPLTRRWYNGKIDALKALVCNEPTPTPQDETFPPTVSGGQCPGVLYRAFARRVRSNGNGPPGDPACEYFDDGEILVATGLIGPVEGIDSTVVPTSDPSVSTREWFLRHAGGQVILGGFLTGCPDAGFFDLRLEREDGLPDECGDRVTPYQPVNIYNFNNETVTYVDNSNNTTNVLGDFRLFAPIFLPGSIQVPFTFNAGGLTLNGKLDLNGEVSFSPSFEFEIGSDENPLPGPEFDPDSQPGTPEEPSEEQLRLIVGAWVRIVEAGRRSTMVSQGGVVSYYPRWGILKFQVRSPGGIVLTEGIDLKAPEVFVPAPEVGSVIGVQFVPYYGSKSAVRLAFASVPPEDVLVPEE